MAPSRYDWMRDHDWRGPQRGYRSRLYLRRDTFRSRLYLRRDTLAARPAYARSGLVAP